MGEVLYYIWIFNKIYSIGKGDLDTTKIQTIYGSNEVISSTPNIEQLTEPIC